MTSTDLEGPTLASMSEQLLEIADGLYALPLGDFTAARDARAAHGHHHHHHP